MQPRVWIDKVVFVDESSLQLNKNDVVVVVGPNNAGKTTFLREILANASSSTDGSLVKESTYFREGTSDELIAWISTLARRKEGQEYETFLGISFYYENLVRMWNGPGKLEQYSRFFVYFLTTDQRLNASAPVGSFSAANEAPALPIHRLYLDDRLEVTLSSYFRRAYGVDLVVDRFGGNLIPLRVGQKPAATAEHDRASFQYMQKIRLLPFLHSQGDGMRSFAGILLTLAGQLENVLIIDEPETFLHPPQIRLLGRMLASSDFAERQIFMATHSGDFIRGLLESDSSRVRVVRITRDDRGAAICELSNDRLRDLWSDPLLRYSNILDGLFHEKVIICEADGDARFYSAIADALSDNRGGKNLDIMFTHCGGKDRVPMVIRALRNLNVPVSCALDIDVIRDRAKFKDLVESTGGEWISIEPQWKLVVDAVGRTVPKRLTGDVVRDISLVLQSVTSDQFPDDAAKQVELAMRATSPWKALKAFGKAAIPPGDPTRAFSRLDALLRSSGIYLVSEGELEGFVRSIGNHGPKWVAEVLKLNLLVDPELESARTFVSELTGMGGSPTPVR